MGYISSRISRAYFGFATTLVLPQNIQPHPTTQYRMDFSHFLFFIRRIRSRGTTAICTGAGRCTCLPPRQQWLQNRRGTQSKPCVGSRSGIGCTAGPSFPMSPVQGFLKSGAIQQHGSGYFPFHPFEIYAYVDHRRDNRDVFSNSRLFGLDKGNPTF